MTAIGRCNTSEMSSTGRGLNDVDLNLLVALDALLQERNVTRAAERLSVSQPTMSGALGRLRRLFDDELLVRAGRGMRPTALAESLVAPVREILTKVELTLGAARDFEPASDRRTFRVVASDYTALVLIRPLLKVLGREAPNVRLQLREDGLRDYAALLQRGEIDLAIVPSGLARRSEMPTQTILRDRFVAVVWRENVRVGDELTLETLHDLPYLGFRRRGADSNADRRLAEFVSPSNGTTVVESFVIGLHMIRGTSQIAFVQEHLANLFQDAEELRLLEPPVATPPLEEAMSWHYRTDGDPAHRWLRHQVQLAAAALPGGQNAPA
jgi:DNA-binding transcriptional LysR family regulator